MTRRRRSSNCHFLCSGNGFIAAQTGSDADGLEKDVCYFTIDPSSQRMNVQVRRHITPTDQSESGCHDVFWLVHKNRLLRI